MLRNLYYNCYPLKETADVWRDNIEHLCQYGDIFNNRKIVVIKTGEGLEDPATVKQAFNLPDVEFILRPNDPHLQETAGFIETLQHLESLRGDEITFYAHTKGAGNIKPKNICTSIVQWRNRMYHECLSQPEKIDTVMQVYAACGCFFRRNLEIKTKFKWIFAGTFWWVNNYRLFSNSNWQDIQNKRDWPEEYLSSFFKQSETCDLYNSEVNFYVDIFHVYTCGTCGEFGAKNPIKSAICPKCRKITTKAVRVANMYY